MAVEAKEAFASRVVDLSISNPTMRTVYNIFGASNEDQAYDALDALPLPGLYNFKNGRIGRLKNVEMEDVFEKVREPDLTHKAHILYGMPDPDDNEIEYSFSTMNGPSVRITHALSTQAFTGPGRVAPNFGNGINPDPKGKLQGVDVEQPSFEFTLTKHWPTEPDRAYQLAVASISKMINNAEFYGLPKGSVKFLGAVGRKNGLRFSIDYNFSYQRPELNIAIGDIYVIPQKEGWEYISVLNYTVADTASGKLVELPHSAYLQKIIHYADFSILDIGT